MEQWEIDRRKKLDVLTEDGSYKIGIEPFICFTGKHAYIEYQIGLEKEFRKYFKIDDQRS